MLHARLWPRGNPADTAERKHISPYYTSVPSQPDTLDPASRKGSQSLHNYIPTPLRLPFLAAFILIFAFCVMLIELAINNAEPPDSSSSTPTTSATRLDKIKRQSSASSSTLNCESSSLSDRSAEYSSVSSSLCSIFTESYSQYDSTALPDSLLSAASQWVLDIQTVNAEGVSLSETSENCLYPSTTPSGLWTTGFVGCTSYSSQAQPGCNGGATIDLTMSSLITEFSTICAAKQTAVIAETSQARTTPAATTTDASSSAARVSSSAATVKTAQATTSNSAVARSSSATTSSSKAIFSTVQLVSSSSVSDSGSEMVSSTEVAVEPAQSEDGSADTTSIVVPTSPPPPFFAISTKLVAETSQSRDNTDATTTEAATGETNKTPNSSASVASTSVTLKVAVKTSETSKTGSTSQSVLETSVQTSKTDAILFTSQQRTSSPTVSNIKSTVEDSAQTKILSQSTTVISTTATEVPSMVLTTDENGSPTSVSAIVVETAVITTAVLVAVSTETQTSSQELSRVTSLGDNSEDTTALSKSMTVVLTSTTGIPTMILTADNKGNPTNVSTTVVGTLLITTAAPVAVSVTQTPSTTSITRDPQPTGVLSSHEQVIKGIYHSSHYFAALYAAPLLAVLIKVIWGMLYASIRLIQPFERMKTQQGASGKYSLFAQYLSSSITPDMFKALGHYNVVPLMAGFSSAIVQLGTPLASISMTIKAFDVCLINGQNIRCDPRWVINKALLRSVEATLCVCILTVVVIAVVIRRQTSGIDEDPSSIASISSLLNHEPLLHAIQSADRSANGDSFKREMDRYRFHIRYHQTADDTRYGITSSLNPPQTIRQRHSRAPFTYHSVNHDAEMGATGESTTLNHDGPTPKHGAILSYIKSHPLSLDLLTLLCPLLLFTLILAFRLDTRTDGFNAFFNGQLTGQLVPKLLLVGLATLTALSMSQLERTVRITEPFRRLAASKQIHSQRDTDETNTSPSKSKISPFPSPPETTILITRSGTAWSSLPSNISLLATHERHNGRMTFQTLTAIAAILADLNIIAVTGVPFTEAMTWRQYTISSMVSMCLSGILVLVVLVYLGWWTRCPGVKAVRGGGEEGGIETIGGVMRCLGGDVEVIGEITRYADFENQMGRSSGLKSGSGTGNGWFGRRVDFARVVRGGDGAGSSGWSTGTSRGTRKERWRISLHVDENEPGRQAMMEVTEYIGSLQVVER